jgi:hypothetical protein
MLNVKSMLAEIGIASMTIGFSIWAISFGLSLF